MVTGVTMCEDKSLTKSWILQRDEIPITKSGVYTVNSPRTARRASTRENALQMS